MNSTFASLAYYNYRIWFAAALASNIGTWMQRIAQDWLVLVVLTHNSGIAVGITTALQFGPSLVFSAWAGVVADRFSQRIVLMWTQGLSGVLGLGLGALVLSGNASLWHVYLFAGLLGVVAAFDSPARQTFVGQMVPPPMLPNAVGLNSASFNGARLIGPAVAGVLIAIIGTGWMFVINGVTFGLTVLALARMRLEELHPMPSAGRGKGQIREALRYVRRRTDIVVIMVVVGVVSTFGLNFAVTSAMMARVEFGKGPGEYGLLGSVLAIGSLAGALLAARRERPRVRLVIGSALAFGLASGAQALMPTFASYALACIPVGLASLTMMTAANSTIQMSVDPIMRGRVMALYLIVFLGATPIGSPLVGWVSEAWGPRWGIGLGAITATVVSIGAAVWVARNWHLEVRYRVLERPHLMVRYLDAEASAAHRFRAQVRLRDKDSAGVRPSRAVPRNARPKLDPPADAPPAAAPRSEPRAAPDAAPRSEPRSEPRAAPPDQPRRSTTKSTH